MSTHARFHKLTGATLPHSLTSPLPSALSLSHSLSPRRYTQDRSSSSSSSARSRSSGGSSLSLQHRQSAQQHRTDALRQQLEEKEQRELTGKPAITKYVVPLLLL